MTSPHQPKTTPHKMMAALVTTVLGFIAFCVTSFQDGVTSEEATDIVTSGATVLATIIAVYYTKNKLVQIEEEK